ncbi:uncharacterized protein ANIA_11534 [Aspergillus nidulans FGSC A4]|uniref:Uncharacterized protein n=1 Tax=Emericella nidulans (strain FGSC A4 / ATCC 38163 / CBS 112.46 / NRRL 194 / M139) TaxID=227321 RepID=C8V363_EMENI|nr:hypothetical protein [Aspergillus nidulans FGSC A4]CBF71768.1 TPA: hypothetical protein ANIA_11534 [Aspergillus nidulans FGSC A4]
MPTSRPTTIAWIARVTAEVGPTPATYANQHAKCLLDQPLPGICLILASRDGRCLSIAQCYS